LTPKGNEGSFDATARAHLNDLDTYGPPGAARWHIEIAARDLDAAFATAWSDMVSGSVATDGTANAARLAGGKIGQTLRADWWFPAASEFRRDSRFPELMRAVGLMAYWEKHGWPDLCKPVAGSVECT
jgi:hypothetical protein